MSRNLKLKILSTIQSNFHHLIKKRCSELININDNYKYPNLTTHFDSLLKVIKQSPHIKTIKFGKRFEGHIISQVCIPNRGNYFAVPGFYGGFTIEFRKEINEKPIEVTKVEEACQCNTCLSIKNYPFMVASNTEVNELKNWFLVTSSWCRVCTGSTRKHAINLEGYIRINYDF